MQKKLTITIDEEVYNNLYRVVGRRKISQFIESRIRSEIHTENLENGYREMALDLERENEAEQVSDNLIGDLDFESR